MKTRVHAGMSAEQLAALAGVVGAANVDAWRLAQEQVEQERVRRNAEEERERRHQLELLALQNDVNKTALASQAQLGAGLAGALAGAVASSMAACSHASAHRGDRFCAACGAALPARG
jgi:NADH pyrophosphatase NudC (nudix superfamily)